VWLGSANQEVVNRFWQQCGEAQPFPRDLERPVSLALPLTLIKLPHLKLHGIESWFEQRGASFRFNCRSRPVRGCLIAYGGQGLIFVDGADPDDERRFTIAHEIGHFMIDYSLAREKAIARFGEKILEVFDGLRRPTISERVHALLAGTVLGVYTNLMERRESSPLARSEVWDIEDSADRVALALLAPPEDVLSEAETSAASFERRQEIMISLLRERFGLPASVSITYGRSLLESIGRGSSWVEGLGLK
jgi:hypothetical protein